MKRIRNAALLAAVLSFSGIGQAAPSHKLPRFLEKDDVSHQHESHTHAHVVDPCDDEHFDDARNERHKAREREDDRKRARVSKFQEREGQD